MLFTYTSSSYNTCSCALYSAIQHCLMYTTEPFTVYLLYIYNAPCNISFNNITTSPMVILHFNIHLMGGFLVMKINNYN